MASNLEEQLASLKLRNDSGLYSNKNNMNSVLPKQKQFQQPVIPKSCAVNGQCEPCYTSPLQNAKRAPNIPIYSNLVTPQPEMGIKSHLKSSKPDEITYSNIQLMNKKPSPHIYSNINTYSNLPPYPHLEHPDLLDDLPPPPPEPLDYGHCNSTAFPPPPDDLPPPPSPVSSSYSELRRATQFQSPNYQQDYSNYGPSSRSSSTYESIYEPINPRPPSELSSRSNYSLYGSASNTQRRSASRNHEAEVDALTDLLVHSMDSSLPDSDTFGECCKCGQRVVGEGSGCTAMNEVYHISCFTCCHCDSPLQGKPFYSLDGKPYCEQGYLETLEKCSVCQKPILERILRATGRPYHPHCFTCVVCGKSLDGITFTVDAANQIHCIEDFHKKFAPRCCVCKQPIMPEPGEEETVRVVALDRSFHINCYKCEDCGLVLSSEAEGRGCYPLDDHVLCKSCNAKRVQALTSVITTEL
ncbi:lipoma-preferred partner homolog [Planococcus citri]|uniref:lipoma-preferred partner homolog n=1 Tax=Planococcus citri TaxID=170843 RepID=UPI0031F929DA